MADLGGLRAALAAAAASAPGERAGRICRAGVAGVPVAGAAIAVMADAQQRDILYASDAHATVLEELQFELGEGPCVEAFGTRRPVLVADLRGAPDPRWPMFAAAAVARTPARAAFAFPLQVGVIGIGILDLYRVAPGPLVGDEVTAALLVAEAALWSLLDLRARAPDREGGDGAEAGWPVVLRHEHAVVYQASGMVSVQAGVSAEAALALLRGYAFAHDRPLREVALDVVARRLTFTGQEDT